MSELIISENKHYRTRSGVKVKVVAIDLNNSLPVSAVIEQTGITINYTLNGRYISDYTSMPMDIVSEWSEKVYDLSDPLDRVRAIMDGKRIYNIGISYGVDDLLRYFVFITNPSVKFTLNAQTQKRKFISKLFIYEDKNDGEMIKERSEQPLEMGDWKLVGHIEGSEREEVEYD